MATKEEALFERVRSLLHGSRVVNDARSALDSLLDAVMSNSVQDVTMNVRDARADVNELSIRLDNLLRAIHTAAMETT